MPKLSLTQAAVDRLPIPTDKHVTHWDTHLAGFGVRVSPKGRKTWVAQYRVTGGREVVETIATTAVLPKVAHARERARHSMLKAKDGINPVVERKQQQAAEKAAAEAQALTLGRLAERYRAEHLNVNCKPRSGVEIDRLLQRAARFFGDKPVGMISKADILDLVHQPPAKAAQKTNTAGGRAEASNLLQAVRQMMRWAINRDLIGNDPTLGVQKSQARKGERDRVLDDAEIVRFWQGCDAIGYPFGPTAAADRAA